MNRAEGGNRRKGTIEKANEYVTILEFSRTACFFEAAFSPGPLSIFEQAPQKFCSFEHLAATAF